MKKTSILLAALFSSFCMFAQSVETVAPEVYQRVVNSVFEVVLEKQEDTNITYEKELPLERLSYQERTDKYNSIGSAFLLDNGYFYTAAHVLSVYGASYYNDYYIRNSDGDVYKITKIHAFATNRDFVQFEVEGLEIKENMGLPVCNELKTGTTVFSAGNALGEGVVLRNGAFTSRTPENYEGEWKWLRFSAPASPGNSGGPLITAQGEVAGIITMKSENENLNYALPIEEALNAPKNKGLVFTRFYYVIPNIMNEKFFNIFKEEIDLPKDLQEVRETLTEAYHDNIKSVVENVRKTHSPDMEKSFNKVFGKAEFYHDSYIVDYPHVIYLTNSGKWDYAHPDKMQTLDLENNGKVVYGAMMNYVFSTITKPENLTLAEFISNPELYISYVIKGADLCRYVASEKIKITSLGKPCKSNTYTDYFGRTWFVNYFDIKFADSMLISYALPLPTGLFVIYATGSKSSIMSATALDMAFVADFVYASYSGKIKNWKEYLALPEETFKKSPAEKEIKMSLDAEKFNFETELLKLNIPLTDFNLDEQSQIIVATSFNQNDGKLNSENRMTYIYTDPSKENYKLLVATQYTKPMEGAIENTTELWNKLVNRVPPFDSQTYSQKQISYRYDILLPEAAAADSDENKEITKLNELVFQLSGSNDQNDIAAFAEAVEKNLEFKK